MAIEKFDYNVSGEQTLCGVCNLCNGDSNEITIICHARGSSKDSNPTVKLMEQLEKCNVNSFRFDFRGYGESSAGYQEQLTSNFIADLHGTIDMLKCRGFKKFNLIGTSMGGKIVSLVDFDKYGADINSVVLWYPAILSFKNRFDVLRERLFKSSAERQALRDGFVTVPSNGEYRVSADYFVDDRRFIPVDNLKKFGRRIFIVHGTGDQFVSFKDSVYVKKHVAGVELKLVSGGDHGFHDEGCMREALDLTMEFLRVKKRKEIEQGTIHGYTGGTCEMSVGCSLGNGRSK